MEYTNSPCVSVMMACYNAEKYVGEAIESILNQTYTDFELILIDDGSSDKSVEIIEKYMTLDSRIILIKNETNKGQPVSRNIMLDRARGKYLAVMDADDIAFPNRIEKQVGIMDNNSNLGGVSSSVWILDEEGNRIEELLLPGRSPNEVRGMFFFDDVVVHSSVMMRKSILQKYNLKYTEGYLVMQDYDLFSKLVSLSDWIVMEDKLVGYRVVGNSISRDPRKVELGKKIEKSIRKGYLEYWGITPNEKDLEFVLSAISKYKDGNHNTKQFRLFWAFLKLMYSAHGVPFYYQFCKDALKTWKNKCMIR